MKVTKEDVKKASYDVKQAALAYSVDDSDDNFDALVAAGGKWNELYEEYEEYKRFLK